MPRPTLFFFRPELDLLNQTLKILFFSRLKKKIILQFCSSRPLFFGYLTAFIIFFSPLNSEYKKLQNT